MAKYKSPEMSWTLQDVHQDWRHFCRQASCVFDGPLQEKKDSVKVSYLKLWVGVKGLYVFEGFTFAKPEDALKLRLILQKFEEYCAPRKNHIIAVLKFNERRQGESKSFEFFVTDLKILVKDRGFQEEERMVRDAIVFVASTQKFAKSVSIWPTNWHLKKLLKLVETTKRIQTV